MKTLDQKKTNILLGITGAIAAYKIPYLIRLIKKQYPNSDIKAVCTDAAKAFVTELTLQALTQNKVHYKLIDSEAELSMGHIELARWADIILIAPATANTIAKISYGMADDLLSTLTLAAPKSTPILIAPSMNKNMWHDLRTQQNIIKLKNINNFKIIQPNYGEQACGDIGLGRMAEPEDLLINISQTLFKPQILKNKKILITAGPTQEPIDSVRYITNHSSGKMGYALAKQAQDMGAEVYLVSGPTNLPQPSGVNFYKAKTAEQMHKLCWEILEGPISNLPKTPQSIKDKFLDNQLSNKIDIFIAAAAVSDFKPTKSSLIKKPKASFNKSNNTMNLEITQTIDILSDISLSNNNDNNRPEVVIGFAAQDHDLIKYAKAKIKAKNLDLCVANDISNQNIGFYNDNNAVSLVTRDGEAEDISIRSKDEIARIILGKAYDMVKEIAALA